MRRVVRTDPPESFLKRANWESEEALLQYLEGEEHFTFKAYRSPEVRDALSKLFHGKCAFCESRIGRDAPVSVDHFRPTSMVVGLDGHITKPGYWWLGADWDNLHPICEACKLAKGNRFPLVEESERAQDDGDDLDKERALLLDPCRDDPEQYLVFGRDGEVSSAAPDPGESTSPMGDRFEGMDRGRVTIDIFGLNRRRLVDDRQRTANLVLDALDAQWLALQSSPEQTEEVLSQLYEKLLDLDEPFVAMRRQLVASWVQKRLGAEMLSGELEQSVVDEEKHERARQSQADATKRQQAYTVEDDSSTDHYARSSNLMRVEIENFRCIEELAFNFGAGTSDRVGWKVLLGDNGAGKSSVLHAVALALMGPKNFDGFDELDPSSLLRRRKGVHRGSVKIFFAADQEPLEITLTESGIEYPQAGEGLRAIILGFGSARWLPRRGSLEPEAKRFIRVRNLFNPFVPLTDALSWLRKRAPDEFGHEEPGRVEEVLLRLLQLEGIARLVPVDSQIKVQREGQPLEEADSLDELSDGYQTVLAMTVAIMELADKELGGRWEDVAAAEGLVLLDEIGAHLHPRWKLRIVSSLRNAFPNMQFLAATHEPLCLRGLDDGEVLVLRRDEDELLVYDNQPSPDTLSVDQLLTSNMFGLLTTRDLRTEDALAEYYDILSKPESLRSQIEADRLKELGEQVATTILGDTRREQIIYELADEYMAKARHERQERQQELMAETKRKVIELWKEIEAAGGEEP